MAKELVKCPKCKSDLRGKRIPKAQQVHYGGETRFTRVINIYDADKDRHVGWLCPDCQHEWR